MKLCQTYQDNASTDLNCREIAIRDERRQIEKRKVELATMHKMNRGQRNVWLKEYVAHTSETFVANYPSLTETVVIPYSKICNLKLAEGLHSKLPLEIRTMVYNYLLDNEMWEEYECQLMAVTSVLNPEIGHCCCITTGHGLPRLPHFLYLEYMGQGVASEIIAKLYSSSWFEDKTFFGSSSTLHYVIHKDPFGAKVNISPFIRNVDIVCFIDRYRELREQCSRNDTCHHTPYERQYIERGRLTGDYNQLLGLQKNKGFQSLQITLIQRNIRIDVLEEALEALTGVYQAFRAVPGISFRIEWQYANIHCNGFLHSHKRSLGKFFNEPRYTWKHRMLQFLEKVSPKAMRLQSEADRFKMKPCIHERHARFVDEPSLGLSNADFVHRMWGEDETAMFTDEDEDSEFDSDDFEESDTGSDTTLSD